MALPVSINVIQPLYIYTRKPSPGPQKLGHQSVIAISKLGAAAAAAAAAAVVMVVTMVVACETKRGHPKGNRVPQWAVSMLTRKKW
jgi:hypothetical protein